MFVARPAVKSLIPAKQLENDENHSSSAPGALTNDRVSLSTGMQGDPAALPTPLEAYGDVLNVARGLADEDPKRVAKVIKNWVENSA